LWYLFIEITKKCSTPHWHGHDKSAYIHPRVQTNRKASVVNTLLDQGRIMKGRQATLLQDFVIGQLLWTAVIR
jgi:hypothetical protein